MRITVFWCLYCGPPVCGNYHMLASSFGMFGLHTTISCSLVHCSPKDHFNSFRRWMEAILHLWVSVELFYKNVDVRCSGDLNS